MSHDYSHESMEEDPRMIAFFDSLVQRELEGMSSDDSMPSDDAFIENLVQRSGSDSSTPVHSEDDDDNAHASLTLSQIVSPNNTAQQTRELHHLLDMDTQISVATESTSSVRAMQAESSGSAQRNSTNSRASTSHSTDQSSSLAERSRSISALIATKRKDYLSTVNKLTKLEARKAKRKKEKLKKCFELVKLRRDKRRLKRSVLESDSSDSDSSNDDSVSSTSSSSSSSSESSNNSSKSSPSKAVDLDEILNRNSNDARKRTADLKRLARLRQRANLSDDEIDNKDNTNHKTTSNSNCQVSVGASVNPVTTGSCDNLKHTESNGNITDFPTPSSSGGNSLSRNHNGNIAEPGTSNCVNGNNSVCSVKVDNSSFVNKSDSNESQVKTEATPLCKSDATTSVTKETENLPLKYNKRFRNHVKRSKKNYRSRRDDSSHDDSG